MNINTNMKERILVKHDLSQISNKNMIPAFNNATGGSNITNLTLQNLQNMHY
jgi:hypothetical protein